MWTWWSRGGGGGGVGCGGGDHRKGEFDAAALTRCAWSPVCQSIAGVRRVPSRLVSSQSESSSSSFSLHPTT